uniref:Uncharacterized protein n=1 Tax=Oryza glumipatula TaxID=40148 RepID=A0A0E0A007_9ORYZ
MQSWLTHIKTWITILGSPHHIVNKIIPLRCVLRADFARFPPSGAFADITNASVGDSPKNRNSIGVSTPTLLTTSTPFADITNANAGDSRIDHGSDRCTSSNVPQKENMQSINAKCKRCKRKRARERYASMSPKKKEARKMKACVYKQQKEEYPENEHVQSFVIPHCLPFNETGTLMQIY